MSGAVLEGQASFALRGHNPDVLTCIANLSNDGVFTPPELANQMLDTVADAWADAGLPLQRVQPERLRNAP